MRMNKRSFKKITQCVVTSCLILMLFFSCRSGSRSPAAASVEIPEIVLPDSPVFFLIAPEPRPGDPITVVYVDFPQQINNTGKMKKVPQAEEIPQAVEVPQILEAVLLDSEGRRHARSPFSNFSTDEWGRDIKIALIAVPSTVRRNEQMTVLITASGDILTELPLELYDRDFYSETLHLDQRNTNIRTSPDPRRTTEANHLWAILGTYNSEFYATEPFIPTVSSTRHTSFFGSRRIYQYTNGSTDTSVHHGIDYGIPTGTEVLACAPGKVVLARDRLVTGYSVAVEHNPGMYSLYYHMDSISAVEGSFVEAGELLGLSGATGLATGPHLHWELRIAGVSVDPYVFLSRAILDKDEILSRIEQSGLETEETAEIAE